MRSSPSHLREVGRPDTRRGVSGSVPVEERSVGGALFASCSGATCWVRASGISSRKRFFSAALVPMAGISDAGVPFIRIDYALVHEGLDHGGTQD
jgi:hypothetical protein